MTDREKVIKGLEHCIVGVEEGPFCDGCPYSEDDSINCLNRLKSNALELLKEKELVAHATWLCKETSTAYDLYGVKTWAAKYKCSKCGFVHRAIEAHLCYSYCPMCGARMDEDAKEGGSECG